MEDQRYHDDRLSVAWLREMLDVVSGEIERLTKLAFEVVALIQEREDEERAA